MRLLRFIHEEMIKPVSNGEAGKEELKTDASVEQEAIKEKEGNTKLED